MGPSTIIARNTCHHHDCCHGSASAATRNAYAAVCLPIKLAEALLPVLLVTTESCLLHCMQDPGNITVAQVMAMLPYANANAIFTITGQVLINAIKNGLSGYPAAGRFLQVS